MTNSVDPDQKPTDKNGKLFFFCLNDNPSPAEPGYVQGRTYPGSAGLGLSFRQRKKKTLPFLSENII